MFRRPIRGPAGGGGGGLSIVAVAVAAAITAGASTTVAAMTAPYVNDPAVILGGAVDLWLDSRQGVLNGSAAAAADGETISTWETQGNGVWSDVTQGTDGSRPIYRATGWTPNGQPAIDFPTTTTKSLVGTITGPAGGEDWFVQITLLPIAMNARTPFEAVLLATSNQGMTPFYTNDSSATFRWGNGAGNNACTGDPIDVNIARAWSLEGSTTSRTLYENNVALTGGTNPETTSRAIAALTAYRVGTLIGGASQPFNGLIAEMIVFQGSVSADVKTALQGRAAEIWGL